MLFKRFLFAGAASSSFFLLVQAQNSVPIATSPVVVTTTIPTVIETLSTFLSESTSTSNADQVLTVTTTDSDGDETTIISTATGAGAQARFIVTVTRVDTVRITTNTAVVSTIGSTTIFGPDTNTPTSSSEPPTSTSSSETSSEPPPSTIAPDVSSTPPSTSSASRTSSRSSTSTFAVASPSSTSASQNSSSETPAISTGAKVGIALAAILIFCLFFFVAFFMYKRHVAKRDDPYLPSANEKKRNKKDKDGFVYDPEDTSYLNTPYAASQPGTAPGSELASDNAASRYELPGGGGARVAKSTSTSRSRSDKSADWPMGPGAGATTASALDTRPGGGWQRGPYEKG